MNPHDLLVDGCENWPCYPCNLLRPVQLTSTLERYRRCLVDKEKRLFDPTVEAISLLELNDGDDVYLKGNFQNYSDLRRHLLQNRKDPKSRFIFIQAANSRAALSCSRDSFSYLSCFHQVDPSFLNFVFSFGSTEEPLDYHMTGFNCNDTLDVADERLLDIPKLGRSGRELRVQYLLRSLERGSGPTTGNIRQMAVYHTFDLVTGKSLWINVKANDLMETRLKEAIAEFPELGSKAMGSLPGAFAATLAAHMVHLEWCDEDWRECINEIEGKIRKILTKAQTARIDNQPKGVKPIWSRASTMRTSKTSTSELPEKMISTSPSWKKVWHSVRPLDSYDDAGDEPGALSTPSLSHLIRETGKDDGNKIGKLMVLDTFSFEEVQQLHYFGELLETFQLVMKLNDQTLQDIAENYQDLWGRRKFPEEIKMSCEKELASFLRRIHRIRRNLQIRTAQVKSLLAWLHEGKALFDGILQYRNVQIGRIFTESSQVQSEKMEGIAFKTEKETISMHVITSVTLAFLPAMFVTTFFQSGLIEINKDAKHISGAVNLHMHAFELFITICIPLMCFTFGLWILLFKWLSMRARGRAGLNKV